MTFWDILDISLTDDIALIKKAYAKKLRVYHPEDDPKGFQALREAYDEALKYAKNSKTRKKPQQTISLDSSEIEPEVLNLKSVSLKFNNSPENNDIDFEPHNFVHNNILEDFNHDNDNTKDDVDDFINKVNVLYDDFFSRINIENWELLLNSDVMWNVSNTELVNHRFINFLMTHNYFPQNILKLFEKTFYWIEERENLYERYPKDFIDNLINQVTSKDVLSYIYFDETYVTDYETFFNYRHKSYLAIIHNNLTDAEHFITKAFELYPHDPDMLHFRGEYYLRIGKKDEALLDFNNANKLNTNDLSWHFNRAKALFDNNEISASINYFEYLKLRIPNNLDLCCLLGKAYFKFCDFSKAKECFVEALSINKFDTEANIYLTETNLRISEKLKLEINSNPNNKDLRLEFKKIHSDLKKFKFKYFKRFLLFNFTLKLLVCLIILIPQTLLLKSIDFNSLSLDKKYTKIENMENIYNIKSKYDLIDVHISKAFTLDLYRINKKDSKGHKNTVYLSKQEADNQNLFEYMDGYVCMGYIENKIIILIVNYDQAMQIYNTHSIDIKGSLYDMPQDNLLLTSKNLIHSSMQESLLKSKYISTEAPIKIPNISTIVIFLLATLYQLRLILSIIIEFFRKIFTDY